MVKQRMATADVAGEVACLRQRVLGMRVANLYDLNSKVLPDLRDLFHIMLTQCSHIMWHSYLSTSSTASTQARCVVYALWESMNEPFLFQR